MGEWVEAPFGSILDGSTRNGIYKPKHFHGRGVKMVNMGELFAFPRIRDIEMKRVELSDIEKERFCLCPGDLLFARRSLVAEGAGKCSIVIEVNENTAFESSIIRARLNTDICEPLFYYYFFCSPRGEHLLDTIRRQVAVAGITGSDLVELKIPVPSIDEQKTIASILGALDDKIDLNRRMSETLEVMARALFRDWFVDFGPTRAKMEGRKPYLAPDLWSLFPERLDEEDKPEGWQIGTLVNIADLNPETWYAHNAPESVSYVDLSNTKWGTIEAISNYAWCDAPSRARRILRIGDTIVGTVRPGNGSFALVGNNGLTGSTGFAVLRPKTTHYRELVYCAATSSENIDYLSHLADGAAYPAVLPDVVAATKFLLMRDELLRGFSALTCSLIDQVLSNKRESGTLAQTRDLLLPKLMSGEIRLRDAEKMVEEVV